MRLIRKQKKIFVIGRNKTGTTSMGSALASLGFRLGNQPEAELLIEQWAKRDFCSIVKHCKKADAFQDIPFSLDYTYQAMDIAFPGSKFILTVRNSSQEWYESLTRFHTRLLGTGRLPTAKDLQQCPYRKTGWLWRTQQLVYGADEASLYDRELYTSHYEEHVRRVIDYFKHRPDDLLVINLCSDSNSMRSVCDFLNISRTDIPMPHLNSSQDVR